jgi:hypothetical protein
MPRASMRSWLRYWLLLPALLALSTISGSAQAFERQWHLGASAGAVSPAGKYSLGPAVGAYGAYGISDVFDLRLELLGSRHTRDAMPDAAVLSGAAGIAYKLDIIEWVPYGGLLAGYTWSSEELPSSEGPHRSPTVGFILGVDYGFSRSFGVGLAFREDLLLQGGNAQGALLLRGEYRWGW